MHACEDSKVGGSTFQPWVASSRVQLWCKLITAAQQLYRGGREITVLAHKSSMHVLAKFEMLMPADTSQLGILAFETREKTH